MTQTEGLTMTARVFPDGEDIAENYKPVYDLILLDIRMRFMDGMTAARKIREKNREVISIFLTSMAGNAIQGYEVEALDFILKPVSCDVLDFAVRRRIC